ncbi:uncharacterized protein C1orf21 homolog isoform X1 [Malaclemys terrapin pileata]|uniref:uncharacterized protein C1orf21 homolog isoform X1 n=1 Tax=Malaclemys terrapin pileata TaxID=2991368 RepID=UPI0023A84BFC|nr:uncharacterized protein C1orf21 homolog isoform X1 [Malaclemys terrapin pileata]
MSYFSEMKNALLSVDALLSGRSYYRGDALYYNERQNYEYRIKPVEEVKYMKNGGEDDQKVAARNQENLEKSASSNVRLKSNKEVPGLVHQPRANLENRYKWKAIHLGERDNLYPSTRHMHISESQQEFFRMLDEKIEKGRDYCSEEEDIT